MCRTKFGLGADGPRLRRQSNPSDDKGFKPARGHTYAARYRVRLASRRFNGRDIANNGYDLDLPTRVLRDGLADLIAFGRLRNEWMLAETPKETWYARCIKGYIGWPTYQKPPKDGAANYGQGI